MAWGFDRKLIQGYSLLDNSEIAKEKIVMGILTFNIFLLCINFFPCFFISMV